jgi:murein DD-endopeptidase MepM/ murein hydrolase activator NlpD
VRRSAVSASPSAHLAGIDNKERPVHPPHSTLPYSSPERDISSHELWERSLTRSRHRREIADLSRRHRGRRKSLSAVLTAAMVAGPTVPRLAIAQPGDDNTSRTEQTSNGQSAVMLRSGSTGPGVKALQEKLGIRADGIFGPETERAVRDFQRRAGLPVTGTVDVETWARLFGAGVSVIDENSPQAAEVLRNAGGEEAAQAAAAVATEPLPDGIVGGITTLGDGQNGSAQLPAVAEGEQTGTAGAGATPAPGAAGTPGATVRQQPARSRPAPPGVQRTQPIRQVTGGGGGGGDCTSGRLRRPVAGSISSHYGEWRGSRAHGGTDIVAPSGSAIRAAYCGTVSYAGWDGPYGNIVCIRHIGGWTTCYAHMSRVGTSVGSYVRIGQVIGYVGCTGSCTGPHVHFEVRRSTRWGTQVNPEPYLSGRARLPAGGGARAASTTPVRAAKATAPTSTATTPKGGTTTTTPSQPPASPAPVPQSEPAAGTEAAPAPVEEPVVASTEPAPADAETAVGGAEESGEATSELPAEEPVETDPATGEALPPAEEPVDPAAEEPVAEAPAEPAAEPVAPEPAPAPAPEPAPAATRPERPAPAPEPEPQAHAGDQGASASESGAGEASGGETGSQGGGEAPAAAEAAPAAPAAEPAPAAAPAAG